MKYLFTLSCFLLLTFTGNAQLEFTGIASRWSDDFAEWNIYTAKEWTEDEEEDLEDIPSDGELIMRWQNRGDWNTWDYTIGEERGFVRTLFTDDSGKWEIVGQNNEVITFRQIWVNDKREWRITNNAIQLTFKTRWGNRFDEWTVRGEQYGSFHIYSTWEGDPRDWTIVDELDEKISNAMKMAMIFIAVFTATE